MTGLPDTIIRNILKMNVRYRATKRSREASSYTGMDLAPLPLD